jgi:hypothetical protein
MWNIAEQKFATIGEEWEAVCNHVQKVEDGYLERESLSWMKFKN